MPDTIDIRILDELEADGRLSVRELGRRLGMSATATGERIRRLQDTGVLRGFRADVDRRALGGAVTAFVRLATRARDFGSGAAEHPEILECHRLTGSDAFLLKVCVCSIEDLEVLIDELMAYGEPTTSVVLSTAFSDRSWRPPGARPAAPPRGRG